MLRTSYFLTMVAGVAMSSADDQVLREGIHPHHRSAPAQLRSEILALVRGTQAQTNKPAMTDEDLTTFLLVVRQVLARPESVYVEWGAGGSTELVLTHSNATVYSVDSSPTWLQRVASTLSPAMAARWNPLHADIGKVKMWGYPLQSVNETIAARYYQAPLRYLPQADVILIDGRWRVRCALEVYQRAKEGAIVLMHDYTERLKHYNTIERLFVPVFVHPSLKDGQAITLVRPLSWTRDDTKHPQLATFAHFPREVPVLGQHELSKMQVRFAKQLMRA